MRRKGTKGPVSVHRLEIEARPGLVDALAARTQQRLESWLGLSAECVRIRKVYHLDLDIDETEAKQVLDALVDPVGEVGAVGMLDDGLPYSEARRESPWILTVGSLPGVTDSEGRSVLRAALDRLGRPLRGDAYSSTMYLFWGLTRSDVERAAMDMLHNPLVQRTRIERPPRALDLDVPRAGSSIAPPITTIPICEATNAELIRCSHEGLLALSLLEMQAIARHFRALGREPTDAELECIAQTWSEHCKHKIFAAPIEYTDPEGTTRVIEDGLFRRYIRGTTESVAHARMHAFMDAGESFLVSVFHDNAGVVRFTDADHLVYKVETHNTPSALDPYGGAMTGIVGVNRDSFGTGVGADLLANVWGYCFGEPEFRGNLPRGLMHPSRVRDGVHEGVVDGGNQSGVPYARGFELFDECYLGKPLVYCGTVAIMPVDSAGQATHEKRIQVGDHVVMVGGRIGKDGIHGATFSSVELDEGSTTQAVQIGDPIVQKMMFDMLSEARELGLYGAITDNGAGGLSSSVGELACVTGGARIDLSKAPLKYPGLAPWEILVSEAQERMTVAVPPERLEAFMQLARRREVEATVLGTFTDTGKFEVTFAGTRACELDLEFLHHGVPRVTLRAKWDANCVETGGQLPSERRAQELLAELLADPNLASNEDRARHYDHEVKGLSVIKPFIGVQRDVPATATVMRCRHGRHEGVVLAEGIHPWFSAIDTKAMAMACVDEAVRRVLCAGARIDRLAALDNFCWPDPIESDRTPDGAHKLAQLVRCCEGLRAACEAYGVPLISGKDSMKNDTVLGGVKISILPTLLVSVMGQMQDVRRALTLAPRFLGDLVYLLGNTGPELAGSVLARRVGYRGKDVPDTSLESCMHRYREFVRLRDRGLIHSSHVVQRGGLAVALAHMAMACELGIDCSLGNLSERIGMLAALFGESTGRIVVTCAAQHGEELERAFADTHVHLLGRIAEPRSNAHARHGWLRIADRRTTIDLDTPGLRAAFKGGLFGR